MIMVKVSHAKTVREGFVSLVSFVVENSAGGLNHEAHKGHEREDGVSVAPDGAGVTTGCEPTADAVGYHLSVLRT